MSTVRRIASALGGYMAAVAMNALIVSLLFMVGLAVAGVPWWPAVGLLCGLVNAVPQVGGLLSLVVVALASLDARDVWVTMAWAGGAWLVIQIVEGFVLSPRAAGRSGVPPVFSIFLVLAAGFLLGPLGAVFAVPVAAVILIVWRATRRRE